MPPRGMPVLPPARDFVTSAGFGGAAALAAAIVVAVVVLVVVRRTSTRHRLDLEVREREHEQRREDEQHAAAINRCWQRLVWVVETAGIEPAAAEGATLGLGPELALELLRGLLRDAEQLGDDTLASAVTVYLGQFTLVLAQQGSLLSELSSLSTATEARPDEHQAPAEPDAAASPVAVEPVPPVTRVPAGRRRRG